VLQKENETQKGQIRALKRQNAELTSVIDKAANADEADVRIESIEIRLLGMYAS
jgi:hypothetical protein